MANSAGSRRTKPRDAQLHIRLPAPELAAYGLAAAAARLTLSEWVRRTLSREAGYDPDASRVYLPDQRR